MIPVNISQRKAPKIKFAVLYLFSLVLIGIILSAFWGPVPAAPKIEQVQVSSPAFNEEHEVLQGISLLNERFRSLRSLQSMASQHTANVSAESVDAAQTSLKNALDSIQMKSSAYTSANKKKLFDLLATFNIAINADPAKIAVAQTANIPDTSKLMNELRGKDRQITELQNKLAAGQGNLASGNQQLQQLQLDLNNKANRVAELEKQLASRSKDGGNQQNLLNAQKEIQTKTQRIADLEKQVKSAGANNTSTVEIAKIKSDNKYLSLALTSQFKQTSTLTEANKELRAEIEKLKKRN